MKKHSVFREILKPSWKLVIQHKYLWLYGIFASLVTIGVFSGFSTNFKYITNKSIILKKITFFTRDSLALSLDWLPDSLLIPGTPSSVLTVFALLILVVFVIWFSVISQIALIQAATKLYKSKRAKFDFGKLLENSQKYFWPTLVVHICVRILIVAVFILATLPIFYFLVRGNLVGEILSLLVFFFLYSIFEIFIGLMTILIVNEIVISNVDIQTGTKNSLILFRKYWILCVENALMLIVFKVAFSALVIVVLTIVSLPLILSFYLAMAVNFYALAITALSVNVVIAFLIILLAIGIYTAFYISTWTVLHIKFVDEKPISKLLRVGQALKKKLKK